MWEAAIGVVIGHLFALWWVRRDTRKELVGVREMYAGRLEAREEDIKELRAALDKSQRTAAMLERRSRYLESALGVNIERALSATGNGRAPGNGQTTGNGPATGTGPRSRAAIPGSG